MASNSDTRTVPVSEQALQDIFPIISVGYEKLYQGCDEASGLLKFEMESKLAKCVVAWSKICKDIGVTQVGTALNVPAVTSEQQCATNGYVQTVGAAQVGGQTKTHEEVPASKTNKAYMECCKERAQLIYRNRELLEDKTALEKAVETLRTAAAEDEKECRNWRNEYFNLRSKIDSIKETVYAGS